jgi:hypothetical protein
MSLVTEQDFSSVAGETQFSTSRVGRGRFSAARTPYSSHKRASRPCALSSDPTRWNYCQYEVLKSDLPSWTRLDLGRIAAVPDSRGRRSEFGEVQVTTSESKNCDDIAKIGLKTSDVKLGRIVRCQVGSTTGSSKCTSCRPRLRPSRPRTEGDPTQSWRASQTHSSSSRQEGSSSLPSWDLLWNQSARRVADVRPSHSRYGVTCFCSWLMCTVVADVRPIRR